MPAFGSMKEQLLRAFPRDSKVESDEESPFIEVKNCQKEKTQAAWPWIASTIVLTLVLICDIVQRGGQDGQCLIKTRPAFRTDLKDSHPHIELEERVFSGRLWFDKDTETVYRDIDPSEPQYFGPPSPEIDAAWSDLLRGEFVRLTADEARQINPTPSRDPDTHHYHFEPDMFHSLHCLNAARKMLDHDYYSKQEPDDLEQFIQNSTSFPNWHRVHMDHCLDQLRQAIQCHGDLSPVPLYHHNDMEVGLGVGQTHTCRKWEPIRQWMDDRKKLHRQDLGW